ncbi:MAG: twin-arginine translocase TatA/TatE family subunit [Myxococcota bacterium]|jgi:sec-independent protein translocase protein TatA|nr:twin-arginine translocase TatA/TatE family subunit [Myxococcota bacterium]
MQTIMIIGGLSGMELAIILIIVLMVFGVGKLPSVFRQLGTGLRDFQGALRGDEEDEKTPPKEIEDNADKAATASNATATKQTTDAW